MSGPSPPSRFAEIVLPHLDAGYNFARWLTRSRHDAEDVVQDACARALRYLDGFHGGSGRAWFLAIVRNAAFDWIERNRVADVSAVTSLDDVADAPARPRRSRSAARKAAGSRRPSQRCPSAFARC